MILHLLTLHELDQLPDLSTFLRPMEPQPREGTVQMIRDGVDWLAIDKRGLSLAALYSRPFAPDTEIAWGEEWWKWDNGCRIVQCLERPVRTTWPRDYKRQPAATMPVELARYRSVVVECRPLKVKDLTTDECRTLGYASQPLCNVSKFAQRYFKYDWQSNYPSFPFEKSWAWQIDLKGKQ